MIRALGIGLFVAIAGFAGALYADDKVDCSHLPTIDPDHHYKKDERVKEASGDGTYAYQCTSSDCYRASTSATGTYPWKRIGKCK